MIDRRPEPVKIGFRIEGIAGNDRAGIRNARPLPDQPRHPFVMVLSSARVRHARDFVSREAGKSQSVLLHLTHHFVVRKRDQPGMGQGVARDLVPSVDLSHPVRVGFVVTDLHTVSDQSTFFTQQRRVEVESGLHAIGVEKTDQSLILAHTVVVAERQGFPEGLHTDLSFRPRPAGGRAFPPVLYRCRSGASRLPAPLRKRSGEAPYRQVFLYKNSQSVYNVEYARSPPLRGRNRGAVRKDPFGNRTGRDLRRKNA